MRPPESPGTGFVARKEDLTVQLRSRMNGTAGKIHLVLEFFQAYAERDAEQRGAHSDDVFCQYIDELLAEEEEGFHARITDAISQVETLQSQTRGGWLAVKELLQQR